MWQNRHLKATPELTSPHLESVTFTEEGGNHVFSFTFATQAGGAYQVQFTTALGGSPVSWVNQGNTIAGSGQPYKFTHNLGSGAIEPPVRYYRVVAQ